MWNSMPKESKRIVGTFKVWRGLRKSRKLHKGGQSMTKTWLWFRIETDTESKNGRKFRPDQNHQIFQTIAMSHGLNVSTTPITAMGCRQCLPLSVVQLKGKHCQKTHCRNGVVDTFRLRRSGRRLVVQTQDSSSLLKQRIQYSAGMFVNQ